MLRHTRLARQPLRRRQLVPMPLTIIKSHGVERRKTPSDRAIARQVAESSPPESRTIVAARSRQQQQGVSTPFPHHIPAPPLPPLRHQVARRLGQFGHSNANPASTSRRGTTADS
jgi:hypothetical protein